MTKPKINLESPIINLAVDLYKKNVHSALQNTPSIVEDAVIPIYAIPKRKAHQKPKTKPEQIGSGVLVKIKDYYFIFTATHVMLEHIGKPIFTGDGNGTKLQEIHGEIFNSGKPQSPLDNPYDAAVFHLHSELSESLKKVAIGIDDLDESELDKDFPIIMACGFRIKMSNTAGDQITGMREVFPSIEVDLADYKRLNIDPKSHLIISYEDQVLVNQKWQTSPIPRGLSGGGLIKFKGTNIKELTKPVNDATQLLSAITIEHYRDKGGKLGVLIGTRINVHLGLIAQLLPDALEGILK
ncbi:hypothetical protein QLS91_06715 [Flavobacterium sp. LB2P84]|uniref:hypothetical protein n=1 Tax=Flavobacterium yafengii TaxID=3041253 RepID=UPI0024A94DD0|nr:hypothetical protein [Flavobacterium yafengii]MDI6032761.1 hypothetical protein [Flavobacterium yafengii]